MEENQEGFNSETFICKFCKQEIHKDASICHKCGNYQKPFSSFFRNWFVSIISFGTLLLLFVQVFIVIKQTNLAERQVNIAESDRIEAEEVLEKANMALEGAKTVKAEADEILSKVNNDVKRIGDEIIVFGKKVNQTEGRLKSTEQRFSQTQEELSNKVITLRKELSKELDVLQKRNELILLADKAKSLGDGASYDELKKRLKSTNDNNLQNSINAEIFSIKRFYIGMTRLKTVDLIRHGVKVKPEEFSTDDLIADLLKNQKWQVRALMAKELGNRKVKGVPDALIKGMDDLNLDVRRNCIKSFEKLTGFDGPDILDKEYSVGWWSQNKVEVENNFVEN